MTPWDYNNISIVIILIPAVSLGYLSGPLSYFVPLLGGLQPPKYLNQNKQALAITGTANAVSVAEHVMTMLLYLVKQINKSDNLVKSGKFTKKNELHDFFELYKKNIERVS